MQTQERTARKTRSLEEALAKEKALRIAAETKAETAFASWQIAEKMARENFAAAEFARPLRGREYLARLVPEMPSRSRGSTSLFSNACEHQR